MSRRAKSIGAQLVGLAIMGLMFLIAVANDDEVAARGKSKPTPIADRRFDHAAHDKAYEDKQGGKQKCRGCHTVDESGDFQDRGRKAHARCDGCHKFFRRCSSSAKKLGVVCLACHQNFKCVSGPKPDFEEMKNTFVATYSHKQHIQPNASSGRQCEGCHGKFGDSEPTKKGALAGGHGFCAGCHERGVEPQMKDCDGCHVDRKSKAGKVPVALPRVSTQYATTGRFDHQRHARANRVGNEGRECLTCHANIAKSKNDKRIPLPTMQSCYKKCHNGEDAFDATGATCTRCHLGTKGAKK